MAYHKDIREHIRALEDNGCLVRIKRQVNKDTELMPIVRWQFRGLPETGRKAFLFENIIDANGKNHSYYFLPILVVLGILYGITWVLSARKTIKNLLHRKIWNTVLLVAMVVSALLGLFLILSIDFNINIVLPFNMLFWHVEAGVALGIIAEFHIFWHWRYFAKILRVKD